MRVDLDWVSTTEGSPPPSVDVALVCTGGISVPGAPNSIRANKAEFSCSDVMEVSVIDGASNGTVPSVVIGVTVESKDANGIVVDTEEGIVCSEVSAGTRYLSVPVAIVDATAVPPADNDSIVGVYDGGSVELTYADSPTADAVGTATVRCQPSLGINRPASMCSSVDLPQPLRPISATCSPGMICRARLSSVGALWPLKVWGM